jgi:hypothetical protein
MSKRTIFDAYKAGTVKKIFSPAAGDKKIFPKGANAIFTL